jgi:hypothetical protein
VLQGLYFIKLTRIFILNKTIKKKWLSKKVM